MRIQQDGGVRPVKERDAHRAGPDHPYRVAVVVYMTPEERDGWGSGQLVLALTEAET